MILWMFVVCAARTMEDMAADGAAATEAAMDTEVDGEADTAVAGEAHRKTSLSQLSCSCMKGPQMKSVVSCCLLVLSGVCMSSGSLEGSLLYSMDFRRSVLATVCEVRMCSLIWHFLLLQGRIWLGQVRWIIM